MNWNPGKSLLFLTVIVDKTLIFTSNFLEKETLNWKSLDKSFSRFMQFHLLKKFNFAFKKFNFVPLKFNSFIREIQFSYRIPMRYLWGYEVIIFWDNYEVLIRGLVRVGSTGSAEPVDFLVVLKWNPWIFAVMTSLLCKKFKN